MSDLSDVVERLRRRLDLAKKAGEPACWDLPVAKADLGVLIEAIDNLLGAMK